MRPADSNDLVRSVLLSPGTTEYKFVVDGEWRYSPRDPVVVSSAEGTINNCKVVQENCNISWQGVSAGQEVFVSGSFLGWSELVPLAHTANGKYTAHCCLPVRVLDTANIPPSIIRISVTPCLWPIEHKIVFRNWNS